MARTLTWHEVRESFSVADDINAAILSGTTDDQAAAFAALEAARTGSKTWTAVLQAGIDAIRPFLKPTLRLMASLDQANEQLRLDAVSQPGHGSESFVLMDLAPDERVYNFGE
jgi:hypothetical protein